MKRTYEYPEEYDSERDSNPYEDAIWKVIAQIACAWAIYRVCSWLWRVLWG
jgi:hypothetical protein